MMQSRFIGLLFLKLGASLFFQIGSSSERTTPVPMVEFKTVHCAPTPCSSMAIHRC